MCLTWEDSKFNGTLAAAHLAPAAGLVAWRILNRSHAPRASRSLYPYRPLDDEEAPADGVGETVRSTAVSFSIPSKQCSTAAVLATLFVPFDPGDRRNRNFLIACSGFAASFSTAVNAALNSDIRESG